MRSRENALDVTAETFLVAWRRRVEMPTDPDDARAWLFGVAHWCLANLARGDRRSQRLGQRLAETLEVAALPDPARIHESRTDTRQVRQALEALSADDRELVTSRHGRGSSRQRPGRSSACLLALPAPASIAPASGCGPASLPTPPSCRRAAMTTDHDLDTRLQAARGVHDADLPALPAAFLDYLHTSDIQQPDSPAAPVRALPPVPADAPASVLAARQLVEDACERHGFAPARGRRSRRRTGVLFAAAAAVAAAVVLGVAPGSTPQAFADYTFTPTPLSPQEQSELVQACRTQLAQSDSEWAQARRQLIEQSVPVVVDARGSWTHTVLVSTADPQLGTVISDCLLNTQSGLGGVSSGEDPRRASADLTDGIRTIEATSVGGSDESDVATVLTGRAAPDVTSVAVRLPDAHTVDAALANGWWSAWWPGQSSTDSATDPTGIEYTTSSGQLITVPYTNSSDRHGADAPGGLAAWSGESSLGRPRHSGSDTCPGRWHGVAPSVRTAGSWTVPAMPASVSS